MEPKILKNEVYRHTTSMELATSCYTCLSSCSSPADQIILREQKAHVSSNKGLKRTRVERPISEESEPVIRTTKKHPRHRPGCGCTVCNQRPSKKGKHLSRGRNKRRSGPKAEVSQGYAVEAASMQMANINFGMGDVADDMLAEALAGISMDSVIHAASMPLEQYLKENKNTSFAQ